MNLLLSAEKFLILKKINQSDPGYPTIYSNLPLANLYFMRDQQAVSSNGIIIGNMRMSQRAREIRTGDILRVRIVLLNLSSSSVKDSKIGFTMKQIGLGRLR